MTKTRRGEKGETNGQSAQAVFPAVRAHKSTKMDKCPRLPTEDYQEALGTGERPNVLPISHSLYSKRLSFRCRGVEYTAEIWVPLVAIARFVAALLGLLSLQDLHICLCVFVCLCLI